MSMTRRTLVRNLSAISAMPVFSGLSRYALAEDCKTYGTTCPPTPPTPNSIFVLFEGPWIIDQIASGKLRMTTLGKLEAPWNSVHHCPVGLGKRCTSSIDSIPESTAPDYVALPMELGIGEQWSIVNNGPSSSKADITKLFDVPYENDPFVYIKGSNMMVTPYSEDRTVTLDMPDAAYVGGFLPDCIVSGPTIAPRHSGHKPKLNNPYTVVIFEYQASNGTLPAITLNATGHNDPIGLSGSVPNTHIVFRMTHNDTMTPVQHLNAVHQSMRRRIQDVSGDGTILDLNLTVNGVCSQPGENTAGFDPLEMGLMPQHAMLRGGTTYGDCCGGSMILGS